MVGLIIDAKLSFKGHLRYAREKATKASSSLALEGQNLVASSSDGEIHPAIFGSLLGGSTGQHGELEKD